VIFGPRCNWLRILIGGGVSANTRVRQLQLVGHGVAEAPVIDCRKAALGARTVIACQQSVDPGVGCLIEAVRLKPKLDCWRKGRRCSAATFGSRGDAARDFLANSPAAMTADERRCTGSPSRRRSGLTGVRHARPTVFPRPSRLQVVR